MDNKFIAAELPGFRFHPNEEELLSFYLKKTSMGKRIRYDVIGFLNIYHHDPWELPGLAKIGEREWYFFVHRNKRNGHVGRPNRTTANGFWKATGSDRPIRSSSEPKSVLGLKKTLVFYTGRAPRGTKTDWVMNEYRLPENHPLHKEDIVLCKIYRKATSMKILEQRAAATLEDRSKTNNIIGPTLSSPDESQEIAIISSNENSTSDSFMLQKEKFIGLSNNTNEEEDDDIHAHVSINPPSAAILNMDVSIDNPWWIPFVWNMEPRSPFANTFV